jgi:hypothetical protein
VTITNTGTVPIDSIQVTTSGTMLGTSQLLAAPPPVLNLAPGANAVVTLKFASNAALRSASSAALKVSGNYSVIPIIPKSVTGGWGLSFRSVSLK